MKANISFKRITKFEDILVKLTLENIQEKAVKSFSGIKYHNIGFDYKKSEEDTFAIGPINIEINKGEILFITGGNGSGKSTLLKVMTGLYPTDSGEIYIDNEKVRIEEYRELFTAIFYDFHLFDRLYGTESDDQKKIEELFGIFKLDKNVRFENNIFNTHNLSTGQKKRLALLMAMLEDKPIYIFDEWAADQDPVFRSYFYKTLLPSFKSQGKTIIAATHDDRFFHTADRVIKLDYGRLV